MSSAENRRFPRIPHVTSRQIIHVDMLQNPQRTLILTENLSASGIKFTTNCKLSVSQFFLLYLNDQLMREIHDVYQDKKRWLKAGDYYLTKVVWVKEIDKEAGIFEIGASFLEKECCREEDLATFTELMNINILEKLPRGLTLN
jgi:hypothetical protein